MSALVFDAVPPAVAPQPNRADIALFVGFVRRRAQPLPPAVKAWLLESGWARRLPGWQDLAPPFRTGLQRAWSVIFGRELESRQAPFLLVSDHSGALAARFDLLERRVAAGGDVRADLEAMRLDLQAALRRIYELEQVPVPIDSWETFDRLFDWRDRSYSRRRGGVTSYLGAAVRSFFAQGGRKCYVVRAGDPWSMRATRETREDALRKALPGFPYRIEAARHERGGWTGVAHLFGLAEASLLCLPDLADACASPPRRIVPEREAPAFAEQFVECSAAEPAAIFWDDMPPFEAPRCNDEGFERWALAVRAVRNLLAEQARDVQLVAALPLHGEAAEPLALLRQRGWLSDSPLDNPDTNRATLSSAFVQLAWPWLRTAGSARLPGGVESPDGVLAGVLARTVLAHGAFRSAMQQPVLELQDVLPREPQAGAAGRVSVIGRTPAGWRVLSDVTTSADESYRQACIPRLVGSLLRSARAAGEALLFEPSGEALWARLERRFADLLERYWQEGALAGESADDAFSVRCDRSTMSQQDIDAGRLIAELSFTASFPVQRITVALAANEGGFDAAPPGFAATATGLA
jgi:hypothetical protein